VKFLIDAQLPLALAKFLRASGYDALHVHDLGLADSEDPPIWKRAIRLDEIIITKDEDFVVRRILSIKGPVVVWLRVGNCSNAALLAWFAPVWNSIHSKLQAGEILIEVV